MSGYHSGIDDVPVDIVGDCARCEFVGEVEAVGDTRTRVVSWTCPKCGADHEEYHE